MNIKEALAKLDPSNDGHWTVDGAPRMDVLSEIAGETLTRKQVTDAAPDFTRHTTSSGEAPAEATEEGPADPVEKAEGSEDDDNVQKDADKPDEQEAEALGAKIASQMQANAEAEQRAKELELPESTPEAPKSELDILRDDLAEATEAMYAAQKTQEESKIEADRCSNLVNAINVKIAAIEKQDPNHGTKSIRDYLDQQNRNRIARAQGLQTFIAATGVHPADVAKAVNPSAPIDQAMKGRKAPRGSIRPQRI